jgi:hypothetical protein
MLVEGGWGGADWFLSELIKVKIKKKLTLYVVVFPIYFFNDIFSLA